MAYTTRGHEAATRTTEFRVRDPHGHGMLDLERSDHPMGVAWRSWRVIGSALPARIAELRSDWGNGLITEAQCRASERTIGREIANQRRKSRVVANTDVRQ